MPLDSKGNYHISPHRARMSDAGEPKPQDEGREPDQDMPVKDDENGDGLHHHEISEQEDGSFHSVHTHPDGHKEEADHATYDEAKEHQDRLMGCDGMSEDSDSEPAKMDEPEDMAGMYERHSE
jgi:hypothetical protein